MSSQDDYLDELLKEMPLEEEESEAADGEETGRPDMEAVSGMTEDEITRLLDQRTAGGREAGEEAHSSGKGDSGQEDVLGMLDGTEDRELKEIRNLLEKSDKNETIGGADSSLAGSGRDENPADRLLADIEEAGEKEVAADVMDSKSRRALKKERRREQKEEKKRARQAAKAQKGKKAGEKVMAAEPRTSSQESNGGIGREYDGMMDKELLDSIVSGAGRVGRQEDERQERPAAPMSETAGDSAGASIADLLSYAQADLEAAADSEADWVEQQGGSSELDILAVDMDEADSMLADISEKQGDKEKKDGFLSKMVSFLTEEDEPEAENEDVQLSEENEEILKDLDKEAPKKAAKAKKGKKKPAKKKDKKAKPKKPPKPKKAKKPKEPEAYPLGKRLTFKKALPIILFGVSLGLAIFILTNLSTDYMDKQAALEAYRAGDYEACYQNLFGKKLDETEAMMYGRSESILYIRLWYREYEMLVESGEEVKALDSLIQTIKEYPDLYEYAAQWNAGMDVYEVYQKMLDILSDKYGITEVEALQIAAVKSDLQYTRIVTALAEGKGYGSDAGQGTKAMTLAEWYGSDDRTQLEAQVNQMQAGSGMNFYVEVQDPDVIVYNYKYIESLSLDGMTLEELQGYLGTVLDEQYAVFAQSVREFRETYGIPVTAIRIRYLNADGTQLFSRDYTEDYVPGSDGPGQDTDLPDVLPEESEIEAGGFAGE